MVPAQLGVFLDRAVLQRLHALFHLVGFRALRRGEACGIRWVDIDIDLDAGLLTVQTQLVQVGWKVEEADPKTDSEAPIALDKLTVPDRTRNGWRGARHGRRRVGCSPASTVRSCIPRG
ncbi:hypothetical protein ACFY3V_38430 [Streptosporangium sp. NPDC000095]|uniref:hypothetical protein n=1 Tax=Streptosporangium sp. NPDC000095 TaxID=3366184 RepID=UPI0036C7A99D